MYSTASLRVHVCILRLSPFLRFDTVIVVNRNEEVRVHGLRYNQLRKDTCRIYLSNSSWFLKV